MDAFVLLLDIVSAHGPPFSKIVESHGIDGPWIVAHIGQGGMADDWWQSAPGKIAAPPILNWESGAKKCGDLSGMSLYMHSVLKNANFHSSAEYWHP